MMTLQLNMPDELWATLQEAAQMRNQPLEEIVIELLQDYLDEPSDEQILANIREGMLDALSGNVRPALEFLDELEMNK